MHRESTVLQAIWKGILSVITRNGRIPGRLAQTDARIDNEIYVHRIVEIGYEYGVGPVGNAERQSVIPVVIETADSRTAVIEIY